MREDGEGSWKFQRGKADGAFGRHQVDVDDVLYSVAWDEGQDLFLHHFSLGGEHTDAATTLEVLGDQPADERRLA